MLGIETTCPLCGEKKIVYVEEKDYYNYIAGMPVQIAFPYLSADDRERLITGICTRCFPS